MVCSSFRSQQTAGHYFVYIVFRTTTLLPSGVIVLVRLALTGLMREQSIPGTSLQNIDVLGSLRSLWTNSEAECSSE